MRDLKLPMPLTGLAEDVRIGRLSGSPSRRPSGRPFNGAVGLGTLCGAGEEGQEEGHGNSKKFPAPGDIGLIVRCSKADSSPEDEEEEEGSLPEEGEKKRKASPIGEAEGSKRGRTIPPDSFANTTVGEDEWPPRARRPARL